MEYLYHMNYHVFLVDYYLKDQALLLINEMLKSQMCPICGLEHPFQNYKTINVHLDKKCAQQLQLNRFYGNIFVTTYHQLLLEVLDKDMVLFTFQEKNSLKLGELRIIMASSRNEVMICREDKNKIMAYL